MIEELKALTRQFVSEFKRGSEFSWPDCVSWITGQVGFEDRI